MSYINQIQEQMKNDNVNYYIIPTEDDHLSEYVADYFGLRSFVSGFTGSAGTLVIEQDKAGLWTDSRYFLQAEEQLPDEIKLQKMVQGQSSYIDYIEKNIKSGSKIAFNARCTSTSDGRRLSDIAKKTNSTLEMEYYVADALWTNRPQLPANKPFVLSEDITGESVRAKIDYIGTVLYDKKCDYFLVTKLDDIAYLLNMRGNDVTCNPVFYAFMLIQNYAHNTISTLYIDQLKLDENLNNYLAQYNITVKNYKDIYDDLADIENSTILIDEQATNYMLFNKMLKSGTIIGGTSPITLKKVIKNDIELAYMKKFHKIDAVAMVKILHYIKTNIGIEPMSEISVADKLEEFRREDKNFVDLSFETIAGYKDHGAIVHYEANEQSNYVLENSSMLLLDSGAQYLGATTDVTRTISLGNPTEEERCDFTTVLKAHLSLGNAVFKEGTIGMQLDIFAKSKMWEQHLDFGHGTGHGVGAFLNVHEAPIRISPAYNKVAFRPGMVVSNEPGVYKAGKHGVRIENLIYVAQDETNEFGNFLKFENLTLVPIDLDLVDVTMLTDVEKNQLNSYHKRVFEEIAPLLDDETRAFLENATRAI